MQQGVYGEKKTNYKFCEDLELTQQLETFQKYARDPKLCREKTICGAKVHYVADDADSIDAIKASLHNFPNQLKDFVAIQTSMSSVTNRLDKMDNTLAKQVEASYHMMKHQRASLAQVLNQTNNNSS